MRPEDIRQQQLPPGRTCADCDSFERRCSWYLSRQGDETACDWDPIRWRPLGFVAEDSRLKT